MKRVTQKQLASRARMLAAFAEVPARDIQRKAVDKPRSFDVGLHIGTLCAVIYSINGEQRIHKFRPKSAPDLIASLDGGQLAIVGGRYRFTNRGIVDV